MNAVKVISKKFRGFYTSGLVEREVTTSTLVQLLIEDATDNNKLVRGSVWRL